jgi:hypothetical protein
VAADSQTNRHRSEDDSGLMANCGEMSRRKAGRRWAARARAMPQLRLEIDPRTLGREGQGDQGRENVTKAMALRKASESY